jgi:hypothetical protein
MKEDGTILLVDREWLDIDTRPYPTGLIDGTDLSIHAQKIKLD